MTTSSTRLPDQATGMILAGQAFLEPTRKLPEEWVNIDKIVKNYFPVDYNIQKNAAGVTENRFVILVNRDAGQIVFSVKGSSTLSNFASDLLNGGASEYRKIVDQMQAAFDKLKADPDFSGYSFSTTGHSLGGGMGMTFSLRNGLDAQVPSNGCAWTRQRVKRSSSNATGSAIPR